jgi:hypothetical protein
MLAACEHATSVYDISMPCQHAMSACHVKNMSCYHAMSACPIIMPCQQGAMSTMYSLVGHRGRSWRGTNDFMLHGGLVQVEPLIIWTSRYPKIWGSLWLLLLLRARDVRCLMP